MNKPGHILTGISFFFLYQDYGYKILEKYIESIDWNNFVLFYNKKFLFPIPYILFFFILTIIGSTIPDIDLKLKNFFNDPKGERRYLYHRQFTHSLLLWTGVFFYSAYTNNLYLFYFSLGGISHLFGDMITGSVPIFLYGKYYNYWSRIGIDRIYRNPKMYSKFAKFLDKAMIFITGFIIGITLKNLF